MNTKICTHCKKELPATLEYFYKVERNTSGLHGTCIKCLLENKRNHSKTPEALEKSRIALRKWRNNIIEEWREKCRKYRSENKDKFRQYKQARRANEKNGNITEQQIKQIYKSQKGKCYYCKINVKDNYHIDHVVPLSRGGSNNNSNIVIACPTCNMRKNDKLPHEWAEGGKLL